jgi:hypothetical protein
MLYLLRKQIIIVIGLLLQGIICFAQKDINRPNHDNWRYYFGMTLSYTQSYLHTSKHPHFLENDSIQSVEPEMSGGIALGLSATLRLSNHLQAKANPQLILGGQRILTYTLKNPQFEEQPIERKLMPTTIVSFPFSVKFNSDRIDNFRVYVFGGMKLDLDLASNSAARKAENMVKLKPFDYGVETGIGFNFFLPFVTVSPEIKFSNGLANIHSRDANIKYSSVLDKLQSRMIVFTIHLED